MINLEKEIKLNEDEKISLSGSEKIALSDGEKITTPNEEKKEKSALGLFGGMFDLNNDGVIDEQERKKEEEFLKKITGE